MPIPLRTDYDYAWKEAYQSEVFRMSRYTPIIIEVFGLKRFTLQSLVSESDVLRIMVHNDFGLALTIECDSYISYRMIDEGDAFITRDNVSKSGGVGKTMYEVAESDYLRWFDAESIGRIVRNPEMKHYSIMTVNDIIDVIALEVPTVK